MILILDHAPGDPLPLPPQLLSAEPRRARCSRSACLRRLGVPRPPRAIAPRTRDVAMSTSTPATPPCARD